MLRFALCMRGDAVAELVSGLELDFMSSGVCLLCLTFVAFPLDLGDVRTARREARKLAPVMWEEGLDLAAMLALENANRDGLPHAQDALEDVSRDGARSAVAGAILWRLAEGMVEDIRRRRAERQSDPSGAIASTGSPVIKSASPEAARGPRA
jgi:hypothetical protein